MSKLQIPLLCEEGNECMPQPRILSSSTRSEAVSGHEAARLFART